MPQAVKDNKELREAVEEVQPEVVAVSLRLSQSKPVYEAFQSLKEGASWSKLTEAQQRIVDKNLREFTLGGVALEVKSDPCCLLQSSRAQLARDTKPAGVLYSDKNFGAT